MSWFFDTEAIVAAIAWLDGCGPTESQVERNTQMQDFLATRNQQPIQATVTVIQPLRLEHKP